MNDLPHISDKETLRSWWPDEDGESVAASNFAGELLLAREVLHVMRTYGTLSRCPDGSWAFYTEDAERFFNAGSDEARYLDVLLGSSPVPARTEES